MHLVQDYINWVIAGLIAIFFTLYNSNEEFRNIVNSTWNEVKNIIGGIIDGLKELFKVFVEFAKQIWSQCGDSIVNVITSSFTLISTVIKNTLEVIKGVINIAVNIFKGDWQGAGEGIKNLTSKRRITNVVIPGKSSSLRFDENTYEDITIAVECSIKDDILPIK